MIEGVDFTVSYASVDGIHLLHIIIATGSIEGLIIFVLDISNAFHNTILPNPEELVYLNLTYLNMYWYKRKLPKQQLASIN